jgi:hypothetical protein
MQQINPQDKISQYFTYHEFLWLPSWNRLADESDGLDDDVVDRLKVLAEKLDIVREYFDKPIRIHVAYRPAKYNAQIGGAKSSAHCAAVNMEAAVDFDVIGLTCDEAKAMILQDDKLADWDMRMEDLPQGSGWIHLDTRPLIPGHNRCFKP